jgi:hypothetical protein
LVIALAALSNYDASGKDIAILGIDPGIQRIGAEI